MTSSPTHHHDRLSALDALLLCAEDDTSPMHVAAVMLFEAGPLRNGDGTLDVARLQQHVDSRLGTLPRYRQRLDWVPVIEHPVWVDHADFDVRVHVRPVSLPRPGGRAELEALVGQLVAPALDRARPLWEMYVVDGLEGDRFALVSKVHHCIVDGILGAAVIAAVLDMEPKQEVDEVEPWVARPSPRPIELLREEVRHRGQVTAHLLRRGLQWLEHGDEGVRAGQIREVAGGLLSYLKAAVPASHTPFNPPRIGPRRGFHWTHLDMERVKALRRRVGCTINDVVVAVVAGAVRRFLLHQGFDVEGLDFRVMVPVSEHRGAANMAEGNRVSIMIVRLPVDEGNPAERLRRAVAAMREAKGSKQSDALAWVEELGDWTTAPLVGEAGRRAMHLRPFNMVVTNVPGPPMPLYMVGAPLLEAYPLVPLFVNTGVGLALLSYAGQLGIGVNSDPDAVPDASFLVEALEEAFEELDRAVPLKDEETSADGERPTETPPRQRG